MGRPLSPRTRKTFKIDDALSLIYQRLRVEAQEEGITEEEFPYLLTDFLNRGAWEYSEKLKKQIARLRKKRLASSKK